MERPRRHTNDPPLVDYKKSGNTDMKATRYGTDPRQSQRGFYGDQRFWLPFQADWYESVIMSKANPTTEMRYINWHHLRSLASPLREVVEEVYAACQQKGLVNIMAFRNDWNEEMVAQFMPHYMFMSTLTTLCSLSMADGLRSRRGTLWSILVFKWRIRQRWTFTVGELWRTAA